MSLSVPCSGRSISSKVLPYADLAAEAEEQGWGAQICPVEVGYRGLFPRSTERLLRDDIRRQEDRRTIKDLTKTAESGSHWLWTKRKRSILVPKGFPIGSQMNFRIK